SYSGDGGQATAAQINDPTDIFVDASNNLFIADRGNHRIRRVDGKTGIITTVAGTGAASYSGDGGNAIEASLNSPTDMFVDSSGRIFIADPNNNRVRRVDVAGEITTVAGTGLPGRSGDGGPAIKAELYGPSGVFVDSSGDLYIADYDNNRVRRVEGIAAPTTLSIGRFGSESPQVTPTASAIKVVVEPLQPVGTDFWVSIQVGDENSSVENLFGVSFKLNYTNTAIVDALETAQGDFLGTDVVFFPDIDDASGTVSIGASKKAGALGANGYGTVARVKMRFASAASGGDKSVLTLTDIKANDLEGNTIQLTPQGATVEAGGMSVWPGDTDNNGRVDGQDVFPIGRYWRSTGPARSSTSMQWTGQTATAWNPEAATYADANGDGVVDEGDTLAIGLNWGKTHGTSLSASPMLIASMDHAPYLRAYEELLEALKDLPKEESTIKMQEILREAIRIGKRQIIPENTMVLQNYPNPFNPETWIPFQLAEDAEVRIIIYNVSGLVIRTLELGNVRAGTYTDRYSAAHWDGRNDYGEYSSSGIYFCHVQAGEYTAIRKMILAK
ncbi:FlgD immunoglobulin-like domain containing protein, partial [Candidatus Poribacteria bacterium]